jgi:hypothetical protein
VNVGSGYWPSPWPSEDGAPNRLQSLPHTIGLDIRAGEKLQVVKRDLIAATMIVLRGRGEVYLLRHTLFRKFISLPTTAKVERLDPESLAVISSSQELAGGPFWPGGLAAHANGSLYVVYGNWCHRLDADCTLLCSRRLPQPRPYNSFLILPDGTLVMKDFDRTGRHLSHLILLEPEKLQLVCNEIEMPEPCLARLSADGNIIYAVGDRSIFRYHWQSLKAKLEIDDSWRIPYLINEMQTHGWDVVLDGVNAWFMDNGRHTYKRHMLGQGVSPMPCHLIRVSIRDQSDYDIEEICGLSHGTITNPPLFAPERNIAVIYDSGNAVLAAQRFVAPGRYQPLWRKDNFACASHMIYYPCTGELVINDFHRLYGDDIVVLDIDTGSEKARMRIGGPFQSVLFPAPGWQRDCYYVSFTRIARAFVV